MGRTLIAIGMCLLPITANADDAFSFRGVSFGMTEKQVDEIHDLDCFSSSEIGRMCREDERMIRVGDISVQNIYYVFDADGTLGAISVYFREVVKNEIKGAVTEKYGPPDEAVPLNTNTLAGGKVEGEAAFWRKPDVIISYTYPLGKVGQGVLSYASSEHQKKQDEEAKRRAKGNAKDF